jgi:hypothetical protein
MLIVAVVVQLILAWIRVSVRVVDIVVSTRVRIVLPDWSVVVGIWIMLVGVWIVEVRCSASRSLSVVVIVVGVFVVTVLSSFIAIRILTVVGVIRLSLPNVGSVSPCSAVVSTTMAMSRVIFGGDTFAVRLLMGSGGWREGGMVGGRAMCGLSFSSMSEVCSGRITLPQSGHWCSHWTSHVGR